MNFNDVMAHFDFKMSEMMRALHVSRTTVNFWRDNNKIPFKYQCIIEVLTNGKFRANKGDYK
jgi:hypothetical protein